jgi:DUF4097 and DUF4098 domain-containing protein YvlB
MKILISLPLLLLLLVPPAAGAATTINERRAVAADAVIEVNNVAGSIRVRGSDRSDVHVTGKVGEGANGLVIEGDARRLQIRIDYPRSGGGWGGWWGGGVKSDSVLEVEVPHGVELKVGSVSASIEVSGISGRRAELESVSGRVTFAGGPDVLAVESVSGAINVESQGIRELTVETVSGRAAVAGPVGERLRAESVSGRLQLSPVGPLASVQASVVSGGIELSTALVPTGRLSAESLSGSLTVTLPRATSARLEASSFSGSIRSDAGTVEKESFGPGSSLKTTLGGGDGHVRLETFSGALRLRLE